jgi:hypothetical protein
MGDRNTRRQTARRRRKAATRRRAAEKWTLVPRHTKRGDKLMLADYIKALPLTSDADQAKVFVKTGAYKFLARHPELTKKLRPLKLATGAS